MEIVIQRYRKNELENAINDLISRGWTLIKEGEESTYLKEFGYKEKGIQQIDKRSYNRFCGFSENRLFKARLRKVDQ